jgi:PAS domain S-box-containing protein
VKKTGVDNLRELFRSLKPQAGSMSAFLFALGCVAVATLFRLLLDPVVAEDHSLLTIYVPAVLFAGLVGGVRAGTLALLASTVISWWLFLPLRHSFVILSVVDAARLIVFVVVGAFILWGAQRYQKIIESLSKEVALRKLTQNRLQILDHTPFLLAQCNRDVRYVNASKSYAALFGLTPDEIVGKRVVDVVGASGFETMRPHIEAVLAGKRVEYEAEVKVGNVEPRHYQVISVPEWSEQNHVVGYIVSVIDITERIRAFEEKELLLEKLAAEIGIGIWELDLRADRFTRIPGMAALYGLDPATINSAADFRRRVHPDDRVNAAARRDAAIRERQTFHAEFRVIRPNGEMRWMLGVGRTVYDKVTGEPIRMVGLNVDITEKKTNEEEAELQRKELTHLMRVATLGGLSGGIAHELSQPLASILANAQAAQLMLAASAPDLEHVGEILNDIVQEDYRAAQVIRHLRTLLQKGERSEAAISLNELIGSVLQLLHSELIARNIKVYTELKAGLPPISGDSVELQQVLINLIMNAIEAMASAPPSERGLSIVTAETNEGYVEASIRDRGPGISPDQLNRVFEPFITTKAGGLGLGLSICSTIVTIHRGRLNLRNASEGGVVATVLLPKSAQLAMTS